MAYVVRSTSPPSLPPPYASYFLLMSYRFSSTRRLDEIFIRQV